METAIISIPDFEESWIDKVFKVDLKGSWKKVEDDDPDIFCYIDEKMVIHLVNDMEDEIVIKRSEDTPVVIVGTVLNYNPSYEEKTFYFTTIDKGTGAILLVEEAMDGVVKFVQEFIDATS